MQKLGVTEVRNVYTIVILGEQVCEAPLLSVSVRSYDQYKTIYIYISPYGAPTKHVINYMDAIFELS